MVSARIFQPAMLVYWTVTGRGKPILPSPSCIFLVALKFLYLGILKGNSIRILSGGGAKHPATAFFMSYQKQSRPGKNHRYKWLHNACLFLKGQSKFFSNRFWIPRKILSGNIFIFQENTPPNMSFLLVASERPPFLVSEITEITHQKIHQGNQVTSLHPSGSGFALKTVPKPPSPMVTSIP